MPYIDKDTRLFVDGGAQPLNAGQLNYKITQLCKQYLKFYGTSYAQLNEIVGVLECAKQEFYRRVVVLYENFKLKTNGDVYDLSTMEKTWKMA